MENQNDAFFQQQQQQQPLNSFQSLQTSQQSGSPAQGTPLGPLGPHSTPPQAAPIHPNLFLNMMSAMMAPFSAPHLKNSSEAKHVKKYLKQQQQLQKQKMAAAAAASGGKSDEAGSFSLQEEKKTVQQQQEQEQQGQHQEGTRLYNEGKKEIMGGMMDKNFPLFLSENTSDFDLAPKKRGRPKGSGKNQKILLEMQNDLESIQSSSKLMFSASSPFPISLKENNNNNDVAADGNAGNDEKTEKKVVFDVIDVNEKLTASFDRQHQPEKQQQQQQIKSFLQNNPYKNIFSEEQVKHFMDSLSTNTEGGESSGVFNGSGILGMQEFPTILGLPLYTPPSFFQGVHTMMETTTSKVVGENAVASALQPQQMMQQPLQLSSSSSSSFSSFDQNNKPFTEPQEFLEVETMMKKNIGPLYGGPKNGPNGVSGHVAAFVNPNFVKRDAKPQQSYHHQHGQMPFQPSNGVSGWKEKMDMEIETNFSSQIQKVDQDEKEEEKKEKEKLNQNFDEKYKELDDDEEKKKRGENGDKNNQLFYQQQQQKNQQQQPKNGVTYIQNPSEMPAFVSKHPEIASAVIAIRPLVEMMCESVRDTKTFYENHKNSGARLVKLELEARFGRLYTPKRPSQSSSSLKQQQQQQQQQGQNNPNHGGAGESKEPLYSYNNNPKVAREKFLPGVPSELHNAIVQMLGRGDDWIIEDPDWIEMQDHFFLLGDGQMARSTVSFHYCPPAPKSVGPGASAASAALAAATSTAEHKKQGGGQNNNNDKTDVVQAAKFAKRDNSNGDVTVPTVAAVAASPTVPSGPAVPAGMSHVAIIYGCETLHSDSFVDSVLEYDRNLQKDLQKDIEAAGKQNKDNHGASSLATATMTEHQITKRKEEEEETSVEAKKEKERKKQALHFDLSKDSNEEEEEEDDDEEVLKEDKRKRGGGEKERKKEGGKEGERGGTTEGLGNDNVVMGGVYDSDANRISHHRQHERFKTLLDMEKYIQEQIEKKKRVYGQHVMHIETIIKEKKGHVDLRAVGPVASSVPDIRVGFAHEIDLSPTEIPPIVDPVFVRIKQRRSFLYKSWRYDLTRSWEGKSLAEASHKQIMGVPPVYEVEIELVDPQAYMADPNITAVYIATSMLLKLLDLVKVIMEVSDYAPPLAPPAPPPASSSSLSSTKNVNNASSFMMPRKKRKKTGNPFLDGFRFDNDDDDDEDDQGADQDDHHHHDSNKNKNGQDPPNNEKELFDPVPFRWVAASSCPFFKK